MTEIPLPGAHVSFSNRLGGVSEGPYASLNLGVLTDDDPGNVTENRSRLAAVAGLRPDRVAMGRQVHGVSLHEWEAPPRDSIYARPGGEFHEVDGHVTGVPGLGLLVLVADCYPVALSDGARVAMLHCGWRGVAGGIIERGVAALGPGTAAAVGPGIGACCYEVGPEVLDAFAGLEGVAQGRMLDLRAAISLKLERAGVRTVEHVEHCTSCREDLYFSHRRDSGVTGRQGGLVTLDA